MKRHISCSKVRLRKKVIITGHYWSLEVIWWLETQIWCVQSTQCPKKTRKDIWHAPKWDLAKKFCFGVTLGHLRSFWGHLVTRNSNIIGTIDSALKKTYEKAYNMPQSEIWYESYVYGSLLVTWGLEVIWWFETQIWCVQSTQSTKKPRKRHVACPKVRFGEKVLFWGHCRSFGHLEVIWWLETQIW